MKTNYFLDILFDLINESDTLNVREIEADLRSDALHVTVSDGSRFAVQIKRLPLTRELAAKQTEGEIIPLYK